MRKLKVVTYNVLAAIVISPCFALVPILIAADKLREAEWPEKLFSIGERIWEKGQR